MSAPPQKSADTADADASAAAAAAAEAPLAGMQNLSEAVGYFPPAGVDTAPAPSLDGPSSTPPPPPRLIILCGWLNARDAHLAKYVAQHRARFPTARILLLRSDMALYLRTAHRRAVFRPASFVVSAAVADSSSSSEINADTDTSSQKQPPTVLVHCFSNGGVCSLATLQSLVRLPPHVLVLDSCPGFYSWARNHYAFSISLPRWTAPLVHLVLAAFWLAVVPWGRTWPQDTYAAALNDADAAGLATEARRLYLYGTADRAVAWGDVEKHARDASSRGAVARTEKFEGGQHVSHVRVDADRYWRVVTEAWEGSGDWNTTAA